MTISIAFRSLVTDPKAIKVVMPASMETLMLYINTYKKVPVQRENQCEYDSRTIASFLSQALHKDKFRRYPIPLSSGFVFDHTSMNEERAIDILKQDGVGVLSASNISVKDSTYLNSRHCVVALGTYLISEKRYVVAFDPDDTSKVLRDDYWERFRFIGVDDLNYKLPDEVSEVTEGYTRIWRDEGLISQLIGEREKLHSDDIFFIEKSNSKTIY